MRIWSRRKECFKDPSRPPPKSMNRFWTRKRRIWIIFNIKKLRSFKTTMRKLLLWGVKVPRLKILSRKLDRTELTQVCRRFSRSGKMLTTRSSTSTQLTDLLIYQFSNKLWRKSINQSWCPQKPLKPRLKKERNLRKPTKIRNLKSSWSRLKRKSRTLFSKPKLDKKLTRLNLGRTRRKRRSLKGWSSLKSRGKSWRKKLKSRGKKISLSLRLSSIWKLNWTQSMLSRWPRKNKRKSLLRVSCFRVSWRERRLKMRKRISSLSLCAYSSWNKKKRGKSEKLKL